MKHIRLDIRNQNNRDFLYNQKESDTDIGLFYIPTSKWLTDAGIYDYEVVDEQLFMLAVLKYGIEFKEVEEV